ncbi:Uncharacterised protein [Serratia quinivorans]|uniref:Uncharacterized protein n=1 Tax=Serratia quinivorans TaxID=137545 RepID=A0A379Z0F1_9GAMM|nr:Uncharacterised protein [Serratia quinivorans]
MPMQIRLHWLVAILLIITCTTIELRGFTIPGTPLWYVLVVTHFSWWGDGLCIDDRPSIPALAPHQPCHQPENRLNGKPARRIWCTA